MPAVRMTSVWATPRMPMIVDLLQDQRQVERARRTCRRRRRRRSTTPSSSTMSGTRSDRRAGSAAPLEQRAVLASSKLATVGVAARQDLLEFLRLAWPLPWRRSSASSSCTAYAGVVGTEGGPRRGRPPLRLQRLRRQAGISPSTCFRPSLVSIDVTPATGLSVISVDAGVEEVLALRSAPASCRSWRTS